jgi:hypothetical protein
MEKKIALGASDSRYMLTYSSVKHSSWWLELSAATRFAIDFLQLD